MSDSKDYLSHSDELGNIHISEEVLTTIAAAAALEVEGVGSLAASGKEIGERMGKKNLAKSVRIKYDEEDRAEVEVFILMTYGHTIPETGRAVQDSVKNAIESMTGMEVACVHVNVAGVVFPAKN